MANDLEKMSSDAVQSAVLNSTLTHPGTVFPFFGAIGTAGYVIILDGGVSFLLVSGALLIGSVGWFTLNFFGGYDTHRYRYFEHLRQQMHEQNQRKLEDVSNFLGSHQYRDGANQVQKVQDSMASFVEVLRSKYQPTELAYTHYLGVAEKVQLTVLENLEQIVVELKAIGSIDIDYVEDRLAELSKLKVLSEVQQSEQKSLTERRDLYTCHKQGIERLLAMNEEAITELEKFASNVARSSTNGNALQELESALQRISEVNSGQLIQ